MVERYKRRAGDIKRLKSIKADEYKEDVAKLRALRLAAKLSQRALAALIQESQSYVTNVERRVRRIDAYEARRWEQACREHIATEAVRRALKVFAAFEEAARAFEPPAHPTVAHGASTSQPLSIGLPLAADALHGRPPVAATGEGGAAPQQMPRMDAPTPSDDAAPRLSGAMPPDAAASSPENPERE